MKQRPVLEQVPGGGWEGGLGDQIACLPVCPGPCGLMLCLVTLHNICACQTDKIVHVIRLFLPNPLPHLLFSCILLEIFT